MIKSTQNITSSSQLLHNLDSNIYTYENIKVKIITVFTDNGKETALVEDMSGELFEVSKNILKQS